MAHWYLDSNVVGDAESGLPFSILTPLLVGDDGDWHLYWRLGGDAVTGWISPWNLLCGWLVGLCTALVVEAVV